MVFFHQAPTSETRCCPLFPRYGWLKVAVLKSISILELGLSPSSDPLCLPFLLRLLVKENTVSLLRKSAEHRPAFQAHKVCAAAPGRGDPLFLSHSRRCLQVRLP